MGVRVEQVFLRGLDPLIKEGEGAELARAMKVSEAQISLLRACQRGSSLALALRLSRHLGVTVEELVDSQARISRRRPCHSSTSHHLQAAGD